MKILPKHLISISLLMLISQSFSNGFSGAMSPSRLELVANSGDKIKRSYQLYNVGTRPEKFKLKTNDWIFYPDGRITFHDELSEDSCRPWVKLERHKVNILPSASIPRKFRIEVSIPEDAPRKECRFAVLMESENNDFPAQIANTGISIPTAGRLASIVYIAINGAEPKIDFLKLSKDKQSGNPTIKVKNNGDAHGRLSSEIIATDANGVKFSMNVTSTPIMPNQTRSLQIIADQTYKDQNKKIKYPIKLKGRLYSSNDTYTINQTLR